MANIAGRILKSNEINIEGACQLGASHVHQNATQNMRVTQKTPQARIIENNESHIIIQVTCSCGEQINIRGEYIQSD